MNRGIFVYLHANFQLTPNNMKRFPTCMLLDYIGFGIATMAIMLVSKPFNIENALLRDGVLQQSVEDGLVTMLAYWLAEVVVAYGLRLPCDLLVGYHLCEDAKTRNHRTAPTQLHARRESKATRNIQRDGR